MTWVETRQFSFISLTSWRYRYDKTSNCSCRLRKLQINWARSSRLWICLSGSPVAKAYWKRSQGCFFETSGRNWGQACRIGIRRGEGCWRKYEIANWAKEESCWMSDYDDKWERENTRREDDGWLIRYE